MSITRKLALNLGPQALSVLGPYTYLRYLFNFFCSFRSILRAGNFTPLDRAMGTGPIEVYMNGGKFLIDCLCTDQDINDGSFAFGIVREIYIRNCYLRYGVSQVARNAQIVLDLGANRGAFSIMMARQAKFVIAVDFNPFFKKMIAHNMAINGLDNYEIESVLVGSGGMCDDGKTCRTTILDLLRKHNLEKIDLVKMDIEGSEFDLFRSPEWLDRVSALCMEVHPDYGDPQEILTALKSHAFDFSVTDSEFRPTEDLKRAEFIYAWKLKSETKRHSES